MEGEFAARQRVVDFLAGTKSGDSRFEYFKRFHGGTNTTKGNIAFMALPENGEFLKIHKEFEDIRIDYWWALSERSLSLKYTDKLLAQGLKKILDQKTAERSSENQQSQTPQAK